MDRCLLDTSSLSDALQPSEHRLPAVAQHLKQYLRSHGQLTFPEISCYEILRGLHKLHAKVQVSKFQEFCRHSELLPVTYDVLDRAAQLWANGQGAGMAVDDADLIIAATAQLLGLQLVTANGRHFDWIERLRLLDWRQP